jgi:hypothetical protein
MKSTNKAILAALAAAIGLGLSASATAGGRHGHHDRHWGHHDGPRYVVRERVVIQRPVYVAPRPVYVAPPVYAAPVYSGYYDAPIPRHSGIVVNVAIPPLVIPLR